MNKVHEASVYWIHLTSHTNPECQGYIGVSKNPVTRIATYFRRAEKGNHHSINLIEAVKEYGKDIIKSQILFSGTEAECYDKVFSLRPTKNIGWNIVEGGRMTGGAPYGVQKNREKLKAKKDEKEKLEKERSYRISSGTATEEDLIYLKKVKDRKEIHKKRLLGLSQDDHIPDGLIDSRPMCTCNKNFCSINYIRNNKTYYRSKCQECQDCRKTTPDKKPKVSNWQKSGYKKKTNCDLCGFRSVYASQITVYHIDGNLTNVDFTNLRSICLNCIEVVKRKEINWKRGDLIPD